MSADARRVAEQIISYITWVLSSQFCMHHFLVLIFLKFARLTWWDCGGAVFTEPIFYNKQSYLLDFLVRFNYASRQARGHDITVVPPTDDEKQAAQAVLPSTDPGSFLCLTIPSPSQPQESYRYIVPTPCSRPDMLAGRWTRVSITYDVQRGKRVLLKDSWRILLDDFMAEGNVYEILHRAHVPNIPHCSQSGDIGDEFYHTSQTHNFILDHRQPKYLLLPVLHWHYCLVLDTISHKLEDFQSGKEMVQAIYASLHGKLAHFYQSDNVF